MTSLDVHLRAADKADLNAFYRLFVQLQSVHSEAEPAFFRPPEKDEMLEEFFAGILADPERHLLFACLDGIEVGFVLYFLGLRPKGVLQPEQRVSYIHGLVVDAAHRRKGLAARMIEHVKGAARQEDITLLGVDFWSFNAAGRACFERAGFSVRHEFMWQSL